MGRPGSEDVENVRVIYEYHTKQAKSVRTALGEESNHGEEFEFFVNEPTLKRYYEDVEAAARLSCSVCDTDTRP